MTDAIKALEALLEALVSRERGTWYESGMDAQSEALRAVAGAVEDALRTLKNDL